MKIAIVLYDRLTALDAIGPYEVLSRIAGRTGHFRRRPGRAGEDRQRHADPDRRDGSSRSSPTRTSSSCRAVRGRSPSGPGERSSSGCVRSIAGRTWTTSVCTGSLILAAAGLLAGRPATSHWMALGELEALGAKPTSERVVFDGKYVTAAGVSAGIDMALTLLERIAGPRARPGGAAGDRVRPSAALRRRLARRRRRPRSSRLSRRQAASPRGPPQASPVVLRARGHGRPRRSAGAAR